MLIEYVSDCCIDKTSKGFVNMMSFEIIKGVKEKIFVLISRRTPHLKVRRRKKSLFNN